MANIPMRTTTKLMPLSRIGDPKVRRGIAYSGSSPMEPTAKPENSETMLASMLPFAIATTETSPSTVAAKNSGCPNCSANEANGGDTNIIMRALARPPIAEQVIAIPSARADSPRRVMG